MRTKELHAERMRLAYQAKRLWSSQNGPVPRDEFGRLYHIHHKDGDWRNNSIKNLLCVSRAQHDVFHRTERIERGQNLARQFSPGNKHGKGNAGKVRTPEAKEKIAAARRGVPMSEETKRKIALSSIGKNKGRKKSAEEISRTLATKAAKRIGNPDYGNKWNAQNARRGSKLSEADVLVIRSRRNSGEGPTSIARDYNVLPQCIWRICSGRRWAL